jgi:predicted amidohydrolase YtcJ
LPAVVELDLGGAHVYPGFSDAHAHLLGLGTALASVDLVGTKSFAEVIERVKATLAPWSGPCAAGPMPTVRRTATT